MNWLQRQIDTKILPVIDALEIKYLLWRLDYSEEKLRQAFSTLCHLDVIDYVPISENVSVQGWGNQVNIKVSDPAKYWTINETSDGQIVACEMQAPKGWVEVYRSGAFIMDTDFVQYLRMAAEFKFDESKLVRCYQP